MASDGRARLLPIKETMNPLTIVPIIDPMHDIATIHDRSLFDNGPDDRGVFIDVNRGICGAIHPIIIPDSSVSKLPV